MKTLILAFSLLATTAYSKEEKCVELCKPKPKPQVVYKTVTVKEAAVAAPCCAKQELKADANANAEAKAMTGNQSIIINMPQPKQQVKLVKRTLYKTRIKKVVKYKLVYKPNRVQLLLGLSKTKMEVEQDNCCNLTAKRKYEPDFGLQYLRDFGSFTGSIGGTANKTFMLGLGFNW